MEAWEEEYKVVEGGVLVAGQGEEWREKGVLLYFNLFTHCLECSSIATPSLRSTLRQSEGGGRLFFSPLLFINLALPRPPLLSPPSPPSLCRLSLLSDCSDGTSDARPGPSVRPPFLPPRSSSLPKSIASPLAPPSLLRCAIQHLKHTRRYTYVPPLETPQLDSRGGGSVKAKVKEICEERWMSRPGGRREREGEKEGESEETLAAKAIRRGLGADSGGTGVGGGEEENGVEVRFCFCSSFVRTRRA